MTLVRRCCEQRGMQEPEIADPEPFDGHAPTSIDLSGFGTVIFAGGYRPDYARWVDAPGAFDEMGYPIHVEGASSAATGLFFVGVHFLRKRKSSLLCGVGEDATIVAAQVAELANRTSP